jgi:hypothetical protein
MSSNDSKWYALQELSSLELHRVKSGEYLFYSHNSLYWKCFEWSHNAKSTCLAKDWVIFDNGTAINILKHEGKILDDCLEESIYNLQIFVSVYIAMFLTFDFDVRAVFIVMNSEMVPWEFFSGLYYITCKTQVSSWVTIFVKGLLPSTVLLNN